MSGSDSTTEVEAATDSTTNRGSVMYGAGLVFGVLELLLCGCGVFFVTRMFEIPHPLAGAIGALMAAGAALVPGLVAAVLFFLARRVGRRWFLARWFWLPLLPPVLLCILTFAAAPLVK